MGGCEGHARDVPLLSAKASFVHSETPKSLSSCALSNKRKIVVLILRAGEWVGAGDDTYLLLGRDLLLPADLGPDGGRGTCGETGRGPATRNIM